MNVADELEKLQQLHQSGAINDDEYTLAKAKLLRSQPNAPPLPGGTDLVAQEQQTKLWGMLLHLSILAGFVFPIAGLIAPILIWQLKKDDLPEIDIHGKNAMNWIISQLIYAVVFVLLIFVLIGIPLLMALGLVGVLFPIVAAIKANKGEIWRYPFTITFLE